VYRVEFSPQARQHAAQLPPAARVALADAVEQLQGDPWQGAPYRPGYPPEYRLLQFGGWGIVVYVIGQRATTVTLLELTWAG
jgi:mRNA-degrading endonuclease RelE of RelBE toxin-antitoxin system